MKIEQSVIDVLNKSRIEGNLLFLPPSLDRKLYVKTNDCLLSIGLVWNKKQKCHISETDIEDKLEEIINTGEYNSLKEKKKELQFFPTPKNIVLKMIELAEIKKDHFCLEPSAGVGNIALEIYKISQNLHLIDINPANCKVLEDKIEVPVFNVDFLQFENNVLCDRVIMNPPFTKQQDISHILHAWEFLKPGGILVSVCSPSPFFRTNQKSIDFRAFLEENNANIHDLPEGSFKESGTNIKSKLIKIKKDA